MIRSIFSVTGAERAAFLAFSSLDRGRAVPETELEFATHCAKRYPHQDRKGTRSTKYFPYWSYLLMKNTEELYVSGKHSLPFFFFLLVQKGDRGSLHFFFLLYFPFNSEQPVLRWHWFEHEVGLDDL